MPKKLSLEEVKSIYANQGYALIGEYTGYTNKTPVLCPKGHVYLSHLGNFINRKNRCTTCKSLDSSSKQRTSYAELQSLCSAKNLILLDTEQNYKTLDFVKKFTIKCFEGHQTQLSLYSLKNRAVPCKYCGLKKRTAARSLNIETVAAKALKENHILLSKNYTNNKGSLEFLCPEGHTYKASWNDFQAQKRCRICGHKKLAKAARKPWSEIVKIAKDRGFTLLSSENIYKNNKTKFKAVCSKGHEFLSSWGRLNNKNGCPSCFSLISKEHKIVANLIRELGFEPKENVRTIAGFEGKFEIDLLVKDLAIEIDGLYWHSDHKRPDVKQKNFKKVEGLRKAKISFLAFYTDEIYTKPAVIKSMLQARLGLNKTVGARKLEIKFVSLAERKAFFQANHLEGDVRASEAWGLYLGSSLLCCLSLRKNNRLKTEEIARFATLSGYTVCGGLSKLVKYLNRSLVSYSNNRVGNGEAYRKAGFRLVQRPEVQSYWYTDFKERVWRYKCKRVKDPALLALYPTEKTQAENGVFSHLFKSKRKDVYKVWDYGHRLWIYDPP